jgi:sugar-specific transcriptional regulator TrmB
MDEENDLQQADIQPHGDIEALQKSYKELQAEFTRKSQTLKDLEAKLNSAPKREDIIREYLISLKNGEQPEVITSSSSVFDLAKEKKPTDINQADELVRKYFTQNA